MLYVCTSDPLNGMLVFEYALYDGHDKVKNSNTSRRNELNTAYGNSQTLQQPHRDCVALSLFLSSLLHTQTGCRCSWKLTLKTS